MPPWIFSGIMNSFNEDMETKGILYITDDRTDGIAEKNNMDRMKGRGAHLKFQIYASLLKRGID